LNTTRVYKKAKKNLEKNEMEKIIFLSHFFTISLFKQEKTK